ncbi:outer membrane protein [Fulvimarina sp. MAC8]|uniref:outer membrane protein n=1 Tax=Fulvimarina sp. MAC8 TaxID=3162874 RepID=UPI0032EFBFC6
MTKNLRAAVVASVSLLGWSTAHAADLPPIYSTPIYEAAPELQPVEIGNGWYLRGDVGYAFESMTDADWTIECTGQACPPAFPQRGQYSDLDVDGDFEFTLGAGHRFTDYLRADVTATRFKTDVTFADGAYDNLRSGDLTAWQVMANGYFDLGTYVGLTPYVGGGVGATHVKMEQATCSYLGGSCTFDNTFTYDTQETSDWRFTYSLMAGVSYDINKSLKLDVGYRYSDVEGADMPRMSVTHIQDGDKFSLEQKDDGFDRHAITVGLRYSLW